MVLLHYNNIILLMEVAMNLNQLEYFIAVAETLNFTKAAEQLYISQTAVTQQIKILEEQLEVKLFQRTKRHVELTPAGKVYLNEAKAIIKRSEEALQKVRLASAGFSGSLKIGFIKGCEYAGLQELIVLFREKFPNISLSFTRDNFFALLNSLDDCNNDIIFNIQPKENKNVNVVFQSFKRIPLYVLVQSLHCSAHKTTITRNELRNETFILMKTSDEDDKYSPIMDGFLASGFLPKNVCYAKDLESLLLMVSANMGVAILPEYNIQALNGFNTLRTIPLINDGELLEISVAWNTNNPNTAITQFINCLNELQTTTLK